MPTMSATNAKRYFNSICLYARVHVNYKFIFCVEYFHFYSNLLCLFLRLIMEVRPAVMTR